MKITFYQCFKNHLVELLYYLVKTGKYKSYIFKKYFIYNMLNKNN